MTEALSLELHDHLERLGNLLRAQARAAGAGLGLQPVQLEALRYLALCNRYSDTPQAVTEYLGLTKGTVSQTLKVLEARGLIEKAQDPGDRRMLHLALTEAGRRLLALAVPPPLLRGVVSASAPADIDALLQGLRRLLRELQRANGLRTFGVCVTCRFNEPVPEGRRCGLTGELLSPPETLGICREHEYPATACSPEAR